MTTHLLHGLDGSDPLAFLAAIGLLRILSLSAPETRLRWVQDGWWMPELDLPPDLDPVDAAVRNVERWRGGHAAVEFAVDADRKVQDLKHPPEDFRLLMRNVIGDREAASFVASFATGVAVDGSGQTKPTSLHFSAGQQRFMDAVVDLRENVTREDLVEALHGPWTGRTGPKGLRWRAASERYRALLSFDPGKEKAATVAGANWLAFQAMPVFPVAPQGTRVVTTGFTGRGKRERFTWPIWSVFLRLAPVHVLLGTRGLADTNARWRAARGVAQVFESAVVRSSQGYGNFAAANPC